MGLKVISSFLGGLLLCAVSAEAQTQFQVAAQANVGASTAGFGQVRGYSGSRAALGGGVVVDAFPYLQHYGLHSGVGYMSRELQVSPVAGLLASSKYQSISIPLQICYRSNADTLSVGGWKFFAGPSFEFVSFTQYKTEAGSTATNWSLNIDSNSRASLAMGFGLVYGFPLGRKNRIVEMGASYRITATGLGTLTTSDGDVRIESRPGLGFVGLEIRYRLGQFFDRTQNEWREPETDFEEEYPSTPGDE